MFSSDEFTAIKAESEGGDHNPISQEIGMIMVNIWLIYGPGSMVGELIDIDVGYFMTVDDVIFLVDSEVFLFVNGGLLQQKQLANG